MAAMTAEPHMLSRPLHGLSRLAGAMSGMAAGPLALPLARFSRRCSIMADAMTSSDPPRGSRPQEAEHPSIRDTLHAAGTGAVWIWRVTTAPIRLVVWLAEAIVTLSMAAILIGIAAWMAGLVPDELLLRLAHPLTEKLAGLLSHALSEPPRSP
ncbi:hypothetical protein ABMY26_01280 [Azospirillum sp. HJ39]|uniref:hypothetical protein n=1 Tax=Azospirillum sp. HJ39 TaxID=3159496 RepID=UPI00355865E3